ncbi:MAG: transporter substrate-binding domain-containing protein [Clostridiales bacterium]|nr:transporter substrate-binding domain-containing protein [Clostridiales bacterium]
MKDYLGFELEGEIQVMDYSALTTSLAESKVDIGMAALCATDERKAVMNFTESYCDSGQVMAVNTETSPKDLTDVSMLESGNYKVAVEKGTASHLYLINAGVPDSCIEVHDTITTAYESLEQGKVDCLLQDGPGMAYYIKTVEDTKLAIVGEEFNQGQSPYAIAISFGCADENEGIVDIMTQAISELTESGTFGELSAEWLE